MTVFLLSIDYNVYRCCCKPVLGFLQPRLFFYLSCFFEVAYASRKYRIVYVIFILKCERSFFLLLSLSLYIYIYIERERVCVGIGVGVFKFEKWDWSDYWLVMHSESLRSTKASGISRKPESQWSAGEMTKKRTPKSSRLKLAIMAPRFSSIRYYEFTFSLLNETIYKQKVFSWFFFVCCFFPIIERTKEKKVSLKLWNNHVCLDF